MQLKNCLRWLVLLSICIQVLPSELFAQGVAGETVVAKEPTIRPPDVYEVYPDMVVLRNRDWVVKKGQKYYLIDPKLKKARAVVVVTKVNSTTSEAKVIKGKPLMSLLAVPYRMGKKMLVKKPEKEKPKKPDYDRMQREKDRKRDKEFLLGGRSSNWGVTLGPHLGLALFNGDIDGVDTDYQPGVSVGVRMGFGNRYFRVESGLGYLQEGVKLEDSGVLYEQSLNYLVVPLDIRLSYPLSNGDKPYLKIGYSWASLQSSKVTLESPLGDFEGDVDVDDAPTENQTRIGLGYAKRVDNLDYNFEIIHIIGKEIEGTGGGPSFKNSGWVLQLGIDWWLY